MVMHRERKREVMLILANQKNGTTYGPFLLLFIYILKKEL